MSIRYPVMVFSAFVQNRSSNRGAFLASVSRADREIADPNLAAFVAGKVSALLPTVSKDACRRVSVACLSWLRDASLWSGWSSRSFDLQDQFSGWITIRVEVVTNDEEYLQWAVANEVTFLPTDPDDVPLGVARWWLSEQLLRWHSSIRSFLSL